MEIRPYRAASDRDGCLAVFDSNLPDYFAPGERDTFARFLDALPAGCAYSVMEHDGGVAGCGGYHLEAPGSARLVWGMVRRDLHRRGLGRFLLLYRLRDISRNSPVELVTLDTTPRAAGFFASQGFRATATIPDGYGPGLDRVEMVKRLAVCA